MRSSSDAHPVKTWRTERGFSRQELAGMVQANGGRMNDRFLEAIENGWRHPGYPLAVVLEKITGVAVSTLKTWPLKTGRKRDEAA